jgi:hypothetical protein
MHEFPGPRIIFGCRWAIRTDDAFFGTRGVTGPKASPRLRSLDKRLGEGYCKSQAERETETAPLGVIQERFLAKRDHRLRSHDERPDEGTCNQESGTDEDLRTEISVRTTVEDPENVECPGSPIFNGVASVDLKDHNCPCEIRIQEKLQQEGPVERRLQADQLLCQTAQLMPRTAEGPYEDEDSYLPTEEDVGSGGEEQEEEDFGWIRIRVEIEGNVVEENERRKETKPLELIRKRIDWDLTATAVEGGKFDIHLGNHVPEYLELPLSDYLAGMKGPSAVIFRHESPNYETISRRKKSSRRRKNGSQRTPPQKESFVVKKRRERPKNEKKKTRDMSTHRQRRRKRVGNREGKPVHMTQDWEQAMIKVKEITEGLRWLELSLARNTEENQQDWRIAFQELNRELIRMQGRIEITEREAVAMPRVH